MAGELVAGRLRFRISRHNVGDCRLTENFIGNPHDRGFQQCGVLEENVLKVPATDALPATFQKVLGAGSR